MVLLLLVVVVLVVVVEVITVILVEVVVIWYIKGGSCSSNSQAFKAAALPKQCRTQQAGILFSKASSLLSIFISVQMILSSKHPQSCICKKYSAIDASSID